jgi:hypothetical protein
MTTKLQVANNKTYNTCKKYVSKNIFKCKTCKMSYNNKNALDKHSHIHTNPVYCQFPKCNKIFSPKHTYQYKQHSNSHNDDMVPLDTTYITNLTNLTNKIINKYESSDDEEEDNPELTYIENNKYNKYFNNYNNEKNNLVLFADIALSYYYK